MAASGYIVKLYGHSTDDAEAFSRSLAAVLDTEPDEALKLLIDAPSVLAEGLDKNKAEHLASVIESIKGLCLVEHSDGEVPGAESEDSALPESSRREATIPAAPDESTESREPASNTWQWVLIVLGVGSIGFLIVAYFLTFQEVNERVTSPTLPAEMEETEKDSVAQESESLDPTIALRQEIGELQQKLLILRDRIEEQRALVKSLYSASGVDRHLVGLEQRKLSGLRNQFGRFSELLSDMKSRLERTVRKQDQVDEMRSQ